MSIDASLRDLPEAVASPADPILHANRLRAKCEQLQQTLRSHATIEQAKGILMATQHCTPDAAFEALTTISRKSNAPLRDVAAALVLQTRDLDQSRERS